MKNDNVESIVETTDCPPDASRVMEGLRDTGYDFNTAIADIVDNSIAACATRVDILLNVSPNQEVTVYIADNGIGMDKKMLINAMRYGSDRRETAASLGKFGLGLKTASSAFCKCLSVVTRSEASEPVLKARWDIDYISKENSWLLLWPEVTEDDLDILDNTAKGNHGTLVVWQKVDRLMRQYASPTYAQNALKRIEDSLRFHLALTYQLFLDKSYTDVPNIEITLNEKPIEYWDPFCSKIEGTELLLELNELIDLPGDVKAPLRLKAYMLPGKNEFVSDLDRAYAKVTNDLQGFYVYRENRLIHYGDWMGMFTKEPHGSLLRVFLSFDHKLDEYLNVDIKKSRILIDDGLFDDLKKQISAPRRAADERYRNGVSKVIVVGGQDAHTSSNKSIDSMASQVEQSKVEITDENKNAVEVTNTNGTFTHTISIRSTVKPGQYRVIPVDNIEDGFLWNPCIADGKHAVEINQSHPYYQKIYQPILSNTTLVTGMDSLLWALAEAELSTFNENTREQYEDMRLLVSRTLRKLVAELPEPELDED